MKRLHLHIGTNNLEQSIQFYNALFGAQPAKIKTDYVKWMLDDPAINFAISTRTSTKGVDHLGLQVDDEEGLNALRERLKKADMSIFDEGETTCCYAHSDKSWVEDPSGVAWEAYRTMEDAQLYSNQDSDQGEVCCTPDTKGEPGCCVPSKTTARCCG